MGTSAIVILWYGLLALILLLLSHERSSVTCWTAAIVAVLFLIFSFVSHRRHSKRKLFLMIVLPLLFFGIGSFVFEDSGIYPPMPTPTAAQWVPPSQVELSDFQFQHHFFMDEVSGKIRNNSNATITNLLLRLRLVTPDGKNEVYDLPVKGMSLQAGVVQDFKQTLLGFHPRKGSDWKWDLQVLSASGD